MDEEGLAEMLLDDNAIAQVSRMFTYVHTVQYIHTCMHM